MTWIMAYLWCFTCFISFIVIYMLTMIYRTTLVLKNHNKEIYTLMINEKQAFDTAISNLTTKVEALIAGFNDFKANHPDLSEELQSLDALATEVGGALGVTSDTTQATAPPPPPPPPAS